MILDNTYMAHTPKKAPVKHADHKVSSFTVKEAIQFGWKTFKQNWKFLVVAYAAIYAVGYIPNVLQDFVKGDNVETVNFIIAIIGWIFQMIVGIGVIVITLKYVDGKIPEFADIYKHYALFFNYFLGYLLYIAVVILGFVLLIIPGIYLAIKYQFTTYLIVDKKMGPLEAFKMSGRLTNGIKMKLFYLGLIFMGLSILGLITFGIGFLVIGPVIALATAYVYRKLSPTK